MLLPTNEQETVIYFATHAEKYGFTILNAQTQFPDALIEKDGKQYKVEFEYLASNFLLHQHDPMECDLVVCWTNDTPDIPLPVITLSQEGWQNMGVIRKDWEALARYWRQRAKVSEERAKQLYSIKQAIIAERDAIILAGLTKATDREELNSSTDNNNVCDAINMSKVEKKEMLQNMMIGIYQDSPAKGVSIVASRLNVSRQTIYNYLNDLEKAGRISQNGDSIEVTL